MPQYLQFAITLLTSSAVSAALCALLIWMTRAWISERLRASIQHEYDNRMAQINASLRTQGDAMSARLRAEIDREADKLRLTAQSFGEVQKAAIAKRLNAIEEVWKTILELHDAIPAAVSYFDILLLKEFKEAPTSRTFSEAWQRLNHEPVVMAASDRARTLALLRPYIGEYLWALFSTYQAAILRTVYLVDRAKTEPEKLLWPKDGLLRQHIQVGLGDAALAEFDSLQYGFVRWIQDRFTRKILQAMEHIVAGREFGEAALRQAQLMEAKIREAKHDMPESVVD